MKFKYFLRGLGVGIVFASIIFFVAYRQMGTTKMTDQQVMERAKELGMVEPDTSIKDLLESNTDIENHMDKNVSDTEASSEEATVSTAEATTEAVTTENMTVAESVSVTVEKGTNSYAVAQQLQELGMVADAAEFDDYLIENGYASRIRVGTHALTKGMDFHTIAEAISDPM